MRTLVLLYLCAYVAWADDLEYDDYDPVASVNATTNGNNTLGARGHRPVTKGKGTYTTSQYSPSPIGGTERYGRRPTSTQVDQTMVPEKEVYPDTGGCTHASPELGVLCPNGCELKTMLLKQEQTVKPEVAALKTQVEKLAQSSNNIHDYVHTVSKSLTEWQKVEEHNNEVVNQHSYFVDEQHAYIKEMANTFFPSNIRVLQGVLDKIKQKIHNLEKAIKVQKEQCKEPCQTTCPIPVVTGKECEDVYRRGGKDSQMYLIKPDSSPPYKVFCDQTTKNGGWLLIQNRLDGSVDFGRRWDEYRSGFGNIALNVGKGYCDTPGEYWLGNEHISQLTKMGPTEVLIEMEDWTGAKVYSQYNKFTVQSEVSNYVLAVDGYSGNAGNSFLEGALELFGENRTMTIHNGMMFSTYDRDNDNWIPGDPTKQCSREDGGGWWYNRCHSSNPNGRYYTSGSYTAKMAKHGTDDGVVWMNWKGSWYSLKAISMKIRPFFQPS